MALEDVIKAGTGFLSLNNVLESLKKDAYDPRAFNAFLKYAINAGDEPLRPEARDMLQEELKNDPRKLRNLVEQAAVREQKNLVDAVSKDYKKVIRDVPDKALGKLALDIPDKDKDFYKIVEKIEQKDYEGLRKIYADTFENQVWKDFIENVSEDFLVKKAEQYIEMRKQMFLENYTTEVKRDDKKVRTLSYSKLRDYITDTVEDYKKDEEKTLGYVMLGQAYTLGKVAEKAKANGENRELRAAA